MKIREKPKFVSKKPDINMARAIPGIVMVLTRERSLTLLLPSEFSKINEDTMGPLKELTDLRTRSVKREVMFLARGISPPIKAEEMLLSNKRNFRPNLSERLEIKN
jgi:hypothetical protein